MGLRDIEAILPPGFRFHPSDEELVCHYLYKKIANEGFSTSTMIDVDLHTCEPWHLPDVAKLGENEWYFFSFRDRKYATGSRTNRATTCGYWKATGKDRPVLDPTSHAIIGMRKTLVFYLGRAPHGIKSDWIMHEFRLEVPHLPPKEDWVLCRVFHKSTGETSLKSGIYQHENNMGWLSSNHADRSPIHLIPTSSITHLETHNFSKSLLNPGKLHYNCLDDAETSNLIEIDSRQEDVFSFLLDA